jgi:hypothetical protein
VPFGATKFGCDHVRPPRHRHQDHPVGSLAELPEIMVAGDHRAHFYVDIAHRAALL